MEQWRLSACELKQVCACERRRGAALSDCISVSIKYLSVFMSKNVARTHILEMCKTLASE